MKIKTTPLNDLFILEPEVFYDDRGYFFESYNKLKLTSVGIDIDFIQDNESRSKYGVIRALHYQLDPYSQNKLVRVIKGEIYDVAVDCRRKSPSFGKWFGTVLSAENKMQLLIPPGFAHGFSVLSEDCIIFYKVDNYYNKDSERGIFYNDPHLAIDWQIRNEDVILSEKDALMPPFAEAEMNFK